jgi:hypothetical protein
MPLPSFSIDGWPDRPAGYIEECATEIVEPILAALPQGHDFPQTIRLQQVSSGWSRVAAQPAGSTTSVIELLWDGRYLTQFVFQLGHELGHVIANNWVGDFKPGPYHWIEQACCEALALVAYCKTASRWAGHPDPDRRDAQLEWCYQDRITTSGTLLSDAAAARTWYQANVLEIHGLDSSGDYITIRPAAVLLHRWFLDDLSRIEGLRGRNRWPIGEDFTSGHHRMWSEAGKREGVAPRLADFFQDMFFG